MNWLAGREKWTDAIAYILIEAEQGMAAMAASRLIHIGYWPDQGGPYTGGVYWARVVSGPHDILAGVRVKLPEPPEEVDEDLGFWPTALAGVVLDIQNLEIEIGGVKVKPVKDTLTMVLADPYPKPPGPAGGLP